MRLADDPISTTAEDSTPVEPEEAQASSSPISRFLAARDTACPECGYNLRDATGGACPECGETLELTLRGTSPFGRRATYVLLVFLWLLAAGAIHGTQTWRAVHETVNRSNVFTWTLGNGANVTTLFSSPTSTTTAPRTITINPNAGTTISGSGPTITTSGSFNVVMPTLANQRAGWSAVSWRQWTAAGLWSTIGALAIVGLVFVVLARRHREPSAGLLRTIPVLAWGGFGLYCVMHLLSSVIGVI